MELPLDRCRSASSAFHVFGKTIHVSDSGVETGRKARAVINDQEVKFDGQSYIWSYDPSVPSEPSWHWRGASDNMTPRRAILSKLNREFIKQRAKSVVDQLDLASQFQFVSVLQAMGASDEDLESFGLE